MKHLDIISAICKLIYEQLDHDSYDNIISYEYKNSYISWVIILRWYVGKQAYQLRYELSLHELDKLTILPDWEKGYIDRLIDNIVYKYKEVLQEVEK